MGMSQERREAAERVLDQALASGCQMRWHLPDGGFVVRPDGTVHRYGSGDMIVQLNGTLTEHGEQSIRGQLEEVATDFIALCHERFETPRPQSQRPPDMPVPEAVRVMERMAPGRNRERAECLRDAVATAVQLLADGYQVVIHPSGEFMVYPAGAPALDVADILPDLRPSQG